MAKNKDNFNENEPLKELHKKVISILKERKKKKLFRPGRPRIPGKILVKIIDEIDSEQEGQK